MEEKEIKTPFLDAVKKYMEEEISPFDVPGHHMGNVDNKFRDLIGKKAFQADLNAPIGLDNLANPSGVLKESMDLMAEACEAQNAFFLINGTSSGIITMIIASCRPNDKIIIPRNAHKSITNALILSGATPIYLMPKIDMQLEIAHQPTLEEYKKAILKYPSAKAVLVINPTYFGAVLDLEELVRFAHEHNTMVLVDEAHGAHYYFSKFGPKSAMRCGADMSSVSFHKTGGSLTQSSVLLFNSKMLPVNEVQKALNILNTTSPSTLLMASLDAARYYMQTEGEAAIKRTYELAEYAYEEISKIPGFVPRSKEHFIGKGCFANDPTKLVIEVDRIPLTGPQIYHLLKNVYKVQMELAETYVLLGIIAIGTTKKHIDHLVRALKSISKDYFQAKYKYPTHDFDITFPFMLLRPRSAYQAPLLRLPLEEAEYAISKESIMIYPPGIPVVVPGEVITKDIIKKIQDYRKSGNITILSDYSDGTVAVVDTKIWKRYEIYRPKIEKYINKRLTAPRNDDYYLEHDDFPYQFLFTWPNTVSKNRRINGAFQKELIAITNKLLSFAMTSIMVRAKNMKEINADENENLRIIKVHNPSLKAADETPLIIQNNMNRIRFISYNPNFRFGMESDVKNDTKAAKRLYHFGKYDMYFTENYLPERSSFVLDGERTCLVLDEPLTIQDSIIKLSQREIEENIKIYFNVDQVTWIPNLPQSLIDRGYHFSDLINFIAPNVVAASYPKSKGELSKYMDLVINRLKKAGHDVVRFPIVRNTYPNKMECNAFNLDPNMPLIRSYTAFLKGENFVLIPDNGNDKYSKEVYRKIKKYHPDIEIDFIDTYYLNLLRLNLRDFILQIPRLIEKE